MQDIGLPSYVTPNEVTHVKQEFGSPSYDGISFDDEFSRLASSKGWDPGSRQYSQQRTIAMRVELTSQYFPSSQPRLKGYQDLCSEVDVHPGKSITECRARLKNTYVNIMDLLNVRRMGTKPKVFDNVEALRDYTFRNGRIIDRNEAKKDGGFLASLLQHLCNPRRKGRRGERTNGSRSKVASGRVIKKSQN